MARVDGSTIKISIHALREEGDGMREWIGEREIQFQSTPSARRATKQSKGPDGRR